MVDLINNKKLKLMSLQRLKEHANNLKQAGFQIKGYLSLTNTEKDLKKLRKKIRKAQKKGSKEPDCNLTFKNKTDCIRNKENTASKVKQLSQHCNIDIKKLNTKPKQCEELIKLQGLSSPKKPQKKTKIKKKYVRDLGDCMDDCEGEMDCNVDCVEDFLEKEQDKQEQKEQDKQEQKEQKEQEQKEQDKQEQKEQDKQEQKEQDKQEQTYDDLKKNTVPKLRTMSRELSITEVSQDGKMITISRARKQSLIMGILNKTSSIPPAPPPSPKKKKPIIEENCGGFSRSNLNNMSKSMLDDVLKDINISKAIPESKSGKINYFCSALENGRCDVYNDKLCDGEYVCDMNNKPGVCLVPSQISGKSVESFEYKGKKVVGTKQAISKLKSFLKEEKKFDLPDPFSEEGFRRTRLINKISLATGRQKSFYKEWTVDELNQRLEGLEIEDEIQFLKREKLIEKLSILTGITQDFYKDWTIDNLRQKLEGLEIEEVKEISDHEYEEDAHNILINRIVSITGEDRNKYKDYNLDNLIGLLDHYEIEKSISDVPSQRLDNLIKDDVPFESKYDTDDVPFETDDVPFESKYDVPFESKYDVPFESKYDTDDTEDTSDIEDTDRSQDVEESRIEDLLPAVISDDVSKLSDLSEIQQQIYKCLGLLS
jgi:hypothetical protein